MFDTFTLLRSTGYSSGYGLWFLSEGNNNLNSVTLGTGYRGVIHCNDEGDKIISIYSWAPYIYINRQLLTVYKSTFSSAVGIAKTGGTGGNKIKITLYGG